MAIVKHIAAQALSVASVVTFIISLCCIDSDSLLPIVMLFASEAWIIGYILRDREVGE